MKKGKSVELFSADLNSKWDERVHERNGVVLYDPYRERDYSIPAMGLMGEAGEAGEHFKKYIRDGKPVERNHKLALELGDTLHYLCRCIALAGYSLEEIVKLNEQKIARRERRGVKHK